MPTSDVRPDPKPERRAREPLRVIDRAARRSLLLAEDACASCGRPATNAHHLLRRGSPHFGDDVVENLVPLCGSGTTGCHGAEHGSPYVDARGIRWTADDVRRGIGFYISLRHPEKIAYVRAKIGDGPGLDLLSRRYYLAVS